LGLSLLLPQQRGSPLEVLGNREELAGDTWCCRIHGKLPERSRMLAQALRLGY